MKKYYTFVRMMALGLVSFFGLSARAQTLPEFEPYAYTQLYTWGTSAFQSYQYDIPGGGLISPMRFRLMTPNGFDRNATDGKKYPLIIFLHGSGESAPYDAVPDDGNETQDNERQLVHGGQTHKNAVQNNTFPGLLLYPQIRNPNPALGIGPSWGFESLAAVEHIITKLVEGYKVDRDRIYIHGLSMGGEGAWRFISWKPYLFAAAHPMSAAGSEFWKTDPTGHWSGEARQLYKHIPFRLSQGALDSGPTPTEGNGQVVGVREVGASIRYSYYPTLGHGTWNSEYAKADFFSWFLSKRKNKIHVAGEQSSFCPEENFSVTLGLTAGFANYQWVKNDTTAAPFASGSTTNEVVITQAVSASSGVGTYYARFQRSDGTWTRWSPPQIIDSNRGLSATPVVSANGQSVNLPSLDGSPEIILYGTTGKAAYSWTRDVTVLSNITPNITISTAGSYVLKTRDPAETGYLADGITPTEYRAVPLGCLSAGSTPVVVTTQNGLGVPAPPTNFFASATSNTSVTINWDDRSNDETGFELYRSTVSGSGYKLVTILPASSTSNPQAYLNTALAPNTQYFYRMRAINNSGGSAYTPEVSVTTTVDIIPPTAPILVVGATSRTEINLSWSGATDNVGVFEYDVYQNDVLIATTTSTSYKATGVIAFATYSYVVKARDLTNNVSPPSNQVNPAAVNTGLFYSYYHHPANLTTVNQIVTNGTLIKTGYIAQFRLDPRTANDGFAFIYEGYINIPTTGSYTFFSSSDDGSQIFVNNVLVVNHDGTHGCTEKASSAISLSAGTYPIKVLQFEDGGGECLTVRWQGPGISKAEIPASALKDTYTAPNALTAPNNFSATAASFSQINLSWSDRSNNETGFEISRSGSTNGTYQVVHVTAAGVTSWQNTGLTPSTAYYYKVRAINATSASSLVGPVNASTPNGPSSPGAPSSLAATAPTATQVNLTWTDNSSTETGFEVQKSSSTTSATFVTITTTAAGVNTYSDTQVNGHSTIYYRVRAIRTGATPSGYSNVASVTTPNRAPVMTDIPSQTIFAGTAANIAVVANDEDHDFITFSFTGLPAQVTFESNDYGEGSLTFPATVPAGAYTVTVQASDGSTSDSDNFTVTVGNNHSPVVAATNPSPFSGTLTTEERRVSTLSYTINDPDANPLLDPRSSITGMPPFGASAWNGTTKVLTFTFSPLRGDAGLYNISVTFSDNQGGINVQNFNLIVLPIDEFYTLSMNFAPASTHNEADPWNNTGMPMTTNSPLINLKDDSGSILKFISATTTLSTGGTQWDTFGPFITDLPAPANAVFTEKVRESFFKRSNSGITTITFKNLNPAVQYKVKLYGGYNETDGTVRNTRYTVTGNSGPEQLPDLNTVDNVTETRESAFTVPRLVNGDYVLSIDVTRGANNTGYYYINALVLTAFFDNGNPPEAPSGLTLEAPLYNTVNISWQDNSFNEASFDILRSPTINGTYTLIGSVNANDTSFVDQTTSGRTSYYYKIRAVNVFGSTLTNAQLITTPNGIPVLASLSTIVIQAGQTVQQNLSATDPEGDAIAFTALNLPVFATLVDNGGGAGFIRFAPLASDVGSYTFTIQATDNFSGRSETGGFLVVQDSQYEEVVYLNFTGSGTSANASTPWNNLPALANATSLLNSSGASSPIDLLAGAGWTTSSNDEGVNTGANAGVYPDNVLKSFWSTNVSDPSAGAMLTLSGLTDTKRYNITLLGSRNEFWFANTLYVINGVTKKLNTSKNKNNTVKFSGIQPSGGVITISVKRAGQENASPLVEHRFAALNAMIIEVATPGANPIKPSGLKAEGISKSAIRLTWVDNANDETGYEIYRAEEQGGTFSLIHTTAANIESYTNTSLPQNKAYIYHIRAIKSGGTSDHTQDVFASTFNQIVLINVNSSSASGHLQAPAPPWNNLATPPSAGITFSNFKDDTNTVTPVGLELLNWETGGTNNTGYITGNNGGVYPDAVVENYYYFEQSDPAIHLLLSGLNNSYAYDLLFMGNEWSTIATIGGLIVATDFTVGTETISQFNGKNPYETVSIKGVQPDASNTLGLEIKQNNEARYGVWCALELRSYTPLNTVFDQVPPTVPQDLAATDTTDVSVDLTWSESTDNIGVQGYEVFQGSTLVATVSTTTAQITGLLPSTAYTFSVRAYDVKGNRSGLSSSIQITTNAPSSQPVLYYSKSNGNITNTSTWGRNADGSGNAPSNFTGNNQHFVLTRDVTLNQAWTITGSNSKLIINSTADLTVNATLTAIVDIQNNASIAINTSASPQFGTLAPGSTVAFNASSSTVPGANYGNLVLNGANSTKTFGPGNYVIGGNMNIANNMTLDGAAGNNTVITLSGNLVLGGTPTTANRDQLVSLNFNSGAIQSISTTEEDINFYQIQLSNGTQLNTTGTIPKTITVGSPNGGGLIIGDGSVLTLDNNTLVIEDNGVINSSNETGALSVSRADIIINSSGTQVSNLYFVAAADTVNALRLNASSSSHVNIRSTLYVRDIIDLTSGTLNSNDNIALVSDVNGTARIGKIGTSSSLSGKVEFQRYLEPKGKIYRYMGTPVHATTVAHWIASSLPVTGPFTGTSYANSVHSLYYYDDASGGWIPHPTATSQELMEVGKGYSLYIFEAVNPQKLRISGPIQQGNFTFTNLAADQTPGPEQDSGPGNGWNLLANPYASPIQWGTSGWQVSGLNGTVYVRSNDASSGSNVSTVRVWDGSVGNLPKGIITQGQSFWVKATDSTTPTLTITEDVKYDTVASALQRHASPRNFLKIELSKGSLKDETFIRFTGQGTDGVDTDLDAFKLQNSYFNLSSMAGETNFAINHLPEVFCDKRIPLNIQNAPAGQYAFTFRELTTFDYAVEVRLTDHFTNSETTVGENSTYSFSITSDPASSGKGRFELTIAKTSLDTGVSFDTPSTGICGSGSIPVTLQNTQRDVRYQLMNDHKVIKEVTGTGANIILTIETATLKKNNNIITLGAAFEGCSVITLPATTTLEYVEKPAISIQNDLLVSSSASGNQWLLEGNVITGATGSSFKPAVSGEYTVSVSGATCQVSADPVLFAVTSAETEGQDAVVLYPNAVKSRFVIKLISAVQPGETVTIRILSTQGSLVGEYTKLYKKEGIELSASHLSAGLYTVMIDNGKHQFEKRFMKE
jgi:chitodextrinase